MKKLLSVVTLLGLAGSALALTQDAMNDIRLTPDALSDAAQEIGQRVRRVAESAVTTAFEPQDNPKQNTNGVRDHG